MRPSVSGEDQRALAVIRLSFAILALVLREPRACRVSFIDRDGMEHSVQVIAKTRNEAAVRGLAEFRRMNREKRDALMGPSLGDKLTVRITSEESHELTVAQAKAWLERHGGPSEMVLKHHLRALFRES